VKFVGNYLLAAVSRKKVTSINVYDLSDGSLIMSLKGHRGVIYKLDVTPN